MAGGTDWQKLCDSLNDGKQNGLEHVVSLFLSEMEQVIDCIFPVASMIGTGLLGSAKHPQLAATICEAAK